MAVNIIVRISISISITVTVTDAGTVTVIAVIPIMIMSMVMVTVMVMTMIKAMVAVDVVTAVVIGINTIDTTTVTRDMAVVFGVHGDVDIDLLLDRGFPSYVMRMLCVLWTCFGVVFLASHVNTAALLLFLISICEMLRMIISSSTSRDLIAYHLIRYHEGQSRGPFSLSPLTHPR